MSSLGERWGSGPDRRSPAPWEDERVKFIDAPPLWLIPPGLRRGLALLAVCVLAILPVRLQAGPPRYKVVVLDEIPGSHDSSVPNSIANAINASGQIAGSSGAQAARWTGLVPEGLGAAPGTQDMYVSSAVGINDAGVAVGGTQLFSNGDTTPYINHNYATRWIGMTAEFLGAEAASSQALCINAAGQIAGLLTDATGMHAVRWTGTQTEILAAPAGASSGAYGINASGQVAGYTEPAGNSDAHATRWTGTTAEDLGTLGSDYPRSYGYGINASGQVVGSSLGVSGSSRATLWNGTVAQDLGVSGTAFGINTQGDITGQAFDYATYSGYLFLYTGGTVYNLESLLLPGSGVTSFLVGVYNNINDAGQIAAYGIINGEYHALRLDPVAGGESTDSLAPPTEFTLETSTPPTKGQDFHFQARQDTTAPGASMRVQASPDGVTWTDVPGGTMTRAGSVLWDGHATEIPVGSAFYRVVISAPNYTDAASSPPAPPATTLPVIAGQPQLVIYEEAFDAAGQPLTSAAAGGSVTYRITVVNRGTQVAKKLQVKTIIPDSSFSTSATSHEYYPAQFSKRDVTPSRGGTIYTSDQLDPPATPSWASGGTDSATSSRASSSSSNTRLMSRF